MAQDSSSHWLLWTRQRTSGFLKRWAFFRSVERIIAFEEICSRNYLTFILKTLYPAKPQMTRKIIINAKRERVWIWNGGRCNLLKSEGLLSQHKLGETKENNKRNLSQILLQQEFPTFSKIGSLWKTQSYWGQFQVTVNKCVNYWYTFICN